MKKLTIIPLAISASLFATTAIASNADNMNISEIQKQYSQHVENGKSYKDAYQALQYEIAYETAAMQSATPCKKMVRGL